MTASTISPLFVTPGRTAPTAAPPPRPTQQSQWQSLGLADKLRLYVLTWLREENRFHALANDSASDAVPHFACLRLSDGTLCAIPGDEYANQVQSTLLIGEHIIDSRSVYQRAVLSIKANMTKEGATLFDAMHSTTHKRIHAEEHRLIQKDAEYFWLHNINYPGLVMLMQNHFYQISPEQLSNWVTDALLNLQKNKSYDFAWAREQIDPWLFE